MKRIRTILFAAVILTVVAMLAVSVISRLSGETPSLFGWRVYRISSDSMRPTLVTGDIILCSPCRVEELDEGDIITYRGSVGELAGMNVTHRVWKAPYLEGDDYYLVTKGDDNPAEDTPIAGSSVVAKYEMKLDAVKVIYNFFITPWGLLVTIALIVLAFSGELAAFVRSLFGRTGKNTQGIESNVGEQAESAVLSKPDDANHNTE